MKQAAAVTLTRAVGAVRHRPRACFAGRRGKVLTAVCLALGLSRHAKGGAFLQCAQSASIGVQSHPRLSGTRLERASPRSAARPPRALAVGGSAQVALLLFRSSAATESFLSTFLAALAILLPLSLLDAPKVWQRLRHQDFLSSFTARFQHRETQCGTAKGRARLSKSGSESAAIMLQMDKPGLHDADFKYDLENFDYEAVADRTKVQEIFGDVITDLLHLSSMASKLQSGSEQGSPPTGEAATCLGDDVHRLRTEIAKDPSAIAGIDKFSLESGISVLKDIVGRGVWSKAQRSRLISTTTALVALMASLEEEKDDHTSMATLEKQTDDHTAMASREEEKDHFFAAQLKDIMHVRKVLVAAGSITGVVKS